MKIIIPDGYSVNPGDLSWDPLKALGELIAYDRSSSEELINRIKSAEAILINKATISGNIMDCCPNLKFIGVTATGYDNIDKNAAKARGIALCNVPAYSTDSVAQHTFALILEIMGHVSEYNQAVHQGEWYSSPDFTFIKSPVSLLAGKSLGIIGYGNIGKKVGEIAKAFSMEVNVFSQNEDAAVKSDIVTLHCPATVENNKFVNKDFISRMKDGAMLINTARGALVDEPALADALDSGKLSAAAVDVLDREPPREINPLIQSEKCIVTPHMAWMPAETRAKIIKISAENIQSFLEGGMLNRIV